MVHAFVNTKWGSLYTTLDSRMSILFYKSSGFQCYTMRVF